MAKRKIEPMDGTDDLDEDVELPDLADVLELLEMAVERHSVGSSQAEQYVIKARDMLKGMLDEQETVPGS